MKAYQLSFFICRTLQLIALQVKIKLLLKIFIPFIQKQICFPDNDVRTCTCFHRHDFSISLAFQQHMQTAFFSISSREVSIRNKTIFWNFCMFFVIFHAFHAAFLVTTENQHDLLTDRNIVITQHLHGIETCHCRPFVIKHASAEQITVFLCTFQRILCPVFTNRHNIQMSEHTDAFLSVSICNYTGITVYILCFKTVVLSQFQHIIKRFSRSFSKRGSLARFFVIAQ